MFGHDWVDGQAKIVDRRVTKTSTSENGMTLHSYEYVVDVSVPGKPPFRTTLEDPFLQMDWFYPDVGDVIRVHADVDDQKAKWDRDDPQLSAKWRLGETKEQKDAAKERFDAVASAAPGTPTTTDMGGAAAGTGFQAYMDPELAELVELEAKEKAGGGQGDASSRLQELQQLKDAGMITDAEFAAKRQAIIESI